MAKDWLAATAAAPPHIFRNRKRTPATVTFFRRLLRDNQLDLVTDEIGITPEGWIVNGQHRLAAIMAEDKGAWLAVRYDLPKETFSRIDTGLVRNASTALDLAGYSSTAGTAALVRLAWCWEHGQTSFQPPKLSNDDVLAYVREHPEIAGKEERDPVPYGKKYGSSLPGVDQRYIALFAWLLIKDDSGFLPALVEDNGEAIESNVATLLRKTYAGRLARGQEKDWRKTVGLFIKARNLWGGDAVPSKLQINDREAFPAPEWVVPIALGGVEEDEEE
jgi:hypothetical protein